MARAVTAPWPLLAALLRLDALRPVPNPGGPVHLPLRYGASGISPLRRPRARGAGGAREWLLRCATWVVRVNKPVQWTAELSTLRANDSANVIRYGGRGLTRPTHAPPGHLPEPGLCTQMVR